MRNTLCRTLTILAGLGGSGVMALAALAAAVCYRGRYGESYDFLNHNVSELGEVGVSALAGAFNLSLVIGGACLGVFMIGLGALLGGRVAYLAGGAGAAAAVAAVGVGLYPTNQLAPHTVAALSFFAAGMLAVGLFTLAVLLPGKDRFPRHVTLLGLLTVISLLAFLLLPPLLTPDLTGADYISGLRQPDRPAVMLPSLLEWLAVLALLAWVISVCAALLRAGRSGPVSQG